MPPAQAQSSFGLNLTTTTHVQGSLSPLPDPGTQSSQSDWLDPASKALLVAFQGPVACACFYSPCHTMCVFLSTMRPRQGNGHLKMSVLSIPTAQVRVARLIHKTRGIFLIPACWASHWRKPYYPKTGPAVGTPFAGPNRVTVGFGLCTLRWSQERKELVGAGGSGRPSQL